MPGCCPDLRLDRIARHVGRTSIGVSVNGRPFDASDVKGYELEHAQFVLGQGPIADRSNASRSNECHSNACTDGDVSDETALQRWPSLSEDLEARSVRSVLSFALALDERWPFGTFTLYRYQPARLTVRQTCRLRTAVSETSLTVAAHVMANRRHHDVRCGLHRFDLLDQAIGLVMDDLGVGPDVATARIRSHSFANECPLDHLVVDLIDRRVRLAPH